MKKKDTSISRRSFLSKTSYILAGIGVGSVARWEILTGVSKKLFPEASANTGAATGPKRMIELSFRSGVPFMLLGTSDEFASLGNPQFTCSPWRDNEYVQAENGLYLNENTRALRAHASNIAITQNIRPETGHTNNFDIRRGGRDADLMNPIVQLANKNTTQSVTQGVKWGRQNSVVNETKGAQDLTPVDNDSFLDMFKKPYFPVSDRDLAAISKASEKLSRQQALLLEKAVKNASNLAKDQKKAAELITTDYKDLLDINGMPSTLTNGSGRYEDMGKALAYSVKAMEHNLINSSHVVITTGDWHGFQSVGDNARAQMQFADQVSKQVGEVINFLKNTPDPASEGQTLWDTTVIVMNSEFTRGLSPMGRDNSDGRTQGQVLIGKDVKGGFYGSFDLTGGGYGTAQGFDKDTGAPTPGMRNSASQGYHTVQHLVGNTEDNYNSSEVMKAMVKG